MLGLVRGGGGCKVKFRVVGNMTGGERVASCCFALIALTELVL